MKTMQQYQIINLAENVQFKYKNNNKFQDRYFLLNNNIIVRIDYGLQFEGGNYFVGSKLKEESRSFFTIPMDSKLLNVHKCIDEWSEPELFETKSIFCKFVSLKYGAYQLVLVPLLHSLDAIFKKKNMLNGILK